MQKILGILFLMVLGVNLNAGDVIYQRNGTDYEVYTSTSYTVSVSSYAVTTASSINYNGVERIFKINGSPSGTLFFQRGGSTTTITNSLPLDSEVYYVEDSYLGDIYFQTDTGTVDLRVTELKKINS